MVLLGILLRSVHAKKIKSKSKKNIALIIFKPAKNKAF
jgi:hypothetical protein